MVKARSGQLQGNLGSCLRSLNHLRSQKNFISFFNLFIINLNYYMIYYILLFLLVGYICKIVLIQPLKTLEDDVLRKILY